MENKIKELIKNVESKKIKSNIYYDNDSRNLFMEKNGRLHWFVITHGNSLTLLDIFDTNVIKRSIENEVEINKEVGNASI